MPPELAAIPPSLDARRRCRWTAPATGYGPFRLFRRMAHMSRAGLPRQHQDSVNLLRTQVPGARTIIRVVRTRERAGPHPHAHPARATLYAPPPSWRRAIRAAVLPRLEEAVRAIRGSCPLGRELLAKAPQLAAAVVKTFLLITGGRRAAAAANNQAVRSQSSAWATASCGSCAET